MVYRGKLNLGCANCRKAKKRCGLEQPACSRCVKLKKECPGSLDPTQLFIQDESDNVRRKAQQRDADQVCPQQRKPSGRPRTSVESPTVTQRSRFITTTTTRTDLSTDSDYYSRSELSEHNPHPQHWPNRSTETDVDRRRVSVSFDMTIEVRPKPDDVATNYFLQQFTSNGHWDFVRTFAAQQHMDRCLDLAIKACGMAALTNVELVARGKSYARLLYSDALQLVNQVRIALDNRLSSIQDSDLNLWCYADASSHCLHLRYALTLPRIVCRHFATPRKRNWTRLSLR